MNKIKNWLKAFVCGRFFHQLALAVLLGLLLLLGISFYMQTSCQKYIITEEQAADLIGVDCIIVPGCKVAADGQPSYMLEDRLQTALRLYQAGAAPKLLMSGDCSG